VRRAKMPAVMTVKRPVAGQGVPLVRGGTFIVTTTLPGRGWIQGL